MEGHDKIKVFECDNYVVIFHSADLKLKFLPKHLMNCFKSKDENYIKKLAGFVLSSECIEINSGRPCSKKESPITMHENKQDIHHSLKRLSLVVSNMCNMKCTYCYANNGVYYSNGMMMDRKTALNAINFAVGSFSTIEFINFFGGEPTLNEGLIEIVCEYILYLYKKGIIRYLPRFGLTTNGYAISNHMFQILSTYNFSISISLDGPKEIHNCLRIDKNNLGTYDSVKRNIEKIIEMGIAPEFECTYTGEHYKRGIDMITIMDFFYDNFRCSTVHCPLVIAKPDDSGFLSIETAMELYSNAIRYSIWNLACGVSKSISMVKRLLNSMTTGIPIPEYCPAGKSSITINADGNIYACFMLMNELGFSLGNVNSEQRTFKSPNLIDTLLKNSNKSRNQACQKCWAQTLCFGCIGEDLTRESHSIHRSEIPGVCELCDFKRELIKIFLISIAEANYRKLKPGIER